jgi:hypothetical protein
MQMTSRRVVFVLVEAAQSMEDGGMEEVVEE